MDVERQKVERQASRVLGWGVDGWRQTLLLSPRSFSSAACSQGRVHTYVVKALFSDTGVCGSESEVQKTHQEWGLLWPGRKGFP